MGVGAVGGQAAGVGATKAAMKSAEAQGAAQIAMMKKANDQPKAALQLLSAAVTGVGGTINTTA